MTNLEIEGEKFLLDAEYTYPGRTFEGHPVEGLLFNVRAIQAVFDDANYPQIKTYDTDVGPVSFVYPDTGEWDPDRQTNEFIEALPLWREHGVLAATVGFQGGRPATDAWRQYPWHGCFMPFDNSGFTPEGKLKPAYVERMTKVIEAMDKLGMVTILSYFYFAQDYLIKPGGGGTYLKGVSRLIPRSDNLLRAVDEATRFAVETGRRNIILEVVHEIDDNHYHHGMLKPWNVPTLVKRVKNSMPKRDRLPVSSSWNGFGCLPTEEFTRVSDLMILHSNGLSPIEHKRLIRYVRALDAYKARPQPIVINESGTDISWLNAAFEEYASWGYYDHGKNNYRDGYQSPPTNWTINTDKKKAFFSRIKEITGA